jgi:hypothetical protein
MLGVCLLFVPLRQCASFIFGAWRIFTEIDFAGLGGGGGGAAPFLFNLGDTCESDESWPFCETVMDGSFSSAKKS